MKHPLIRYFFLALSLCVPLASFVGWWSFKAYCEADTPILVARALAGHPGVTSLVEYNTVTLAGSAATPQARIAAEQALKAIGGTWSLRVGDNHISVPPGLTEIVASDQGIKLSGWVSSEDEKAALTALAAKKSGYAASAIDATGVQVLPFVAATGAAAITAATLDEADAGKPLAWLNGLWTKLPKLAAIASATSTEADKPTAPAPLPSAEVAAAPPALAMKSPAPAPVIPAAAAPPSAVNPAPMPAPVTPPAPIPVPAPAPVPTPTPATIPSIPAKTELTGSITDGTLELTGAIPDEAAHQTLLADLKAAAPEAKVIDQLVVVPGIKAPPATLVGSIAGQLASAPGHRTFAFTDKGFTVGGEVTDALLEAWAPAFKKLAASGLKRSEPQWEFSPSVFHFPSRKVGEGLDPAVVAPLVEALKANNIFFASGRSDIRSKEEEKITALIEAIRAVKQKVRFVIGGHSDARGDPEFNQLIGVRRAENVLAALKAGGLNTEDFTVEGFGPSKIVNGPPESYAASRRVEILVR